VLGPAIASDVVVTGLVADLTDLRRGSGAVEGGGGELPCSTVGSKGRAMDLGERAGAGADTAACREVEPESVM
jgi:hypothetical protein